MSAAHRSLSTVDYGARTNTTITAPAGIQNGDILVIVFAIGASPTPPVPTPPAGFNPLTGFPAAYSSGLIDSEFTVRVYAWGKVASSEAGNYTVTHGNANCTAYMFAASGGNTSNPFNPAPTINVQTGSAASPAVANSLTTIEDGSLVAAIYSAWDVFGGATPPAGTTPTFTERWDSANTIMYAADGVTATAGPTGNKSLTLNGAQDDAWVAILIAINADVGGATIEAAARISARAAMQAMGAVARVSAARISSRSAMRAGPAVARISAAVISARTTLRAASAAGQVLAAARISVRSTLRGLGTIATRIGAARILARTGLTARFFQDTTPITAKISVSLVTRADVTDSPVTRVTAASGPVTQAKITVSLGG